MKRILFTALLSMTLAAPGLAQMGGGGMGGGGHHDGSGPGGEAIPVSMMRGGSGIVVADDGSVLLNERHQADEESAAEIINIANDGSERWRVAFDDAWPMMPSTAGDLVVVGLVDQGGAGSGPDDHDGGMTGQGRHGAVALVGIDLSSGVELWTFSLEDASMLKARITDDGSIVYVEARAFAQTGSGTMDQGTAGSTLYALDRFGDVLWSLELDAE